MWYIWKKKYIMQDCIIFNKGNKLPSCKTHLITQMNKGNIYKTEKVINALMWNKSNIYFWFCNSRYNDYFDFLKELKMNYSKLRVLKETLENIFLKIMFLMRLEIYALTWAYYYNIEFCFIHIGGINQLLLSNSFHINLYINNSFRR